MISKATFLIVTYNRCLFRKLEDNPLVQSITTLINNYRATRYLQEILVVVDGSTDYTRDALRLLQENSTVKIRIVFNNKHIGCSATRRKGIKLIKTQLFFMGDDDCLYSKHFLEQNILAFQEASTLDHNMAVLIPPILEDNPTLTKSIENRLIGYTDFPNAWFDFNFDCIPKQKNRPQLLRVSIFKGVSLNKTSAFLEAGNFEELTEWTNDYSEHLEIAYKLAKQNKSFYYFYESLAYCFHIKFGRPNKNKRSYQSSYWPGIKEPLSKIIERSNLFKKNTGCAVSEIDFVLNKIGSFLVFFLKISPEAAISHLDREWERFICKNIYLSGNNQILSKRKRIALFKQSVKKALHAFNVQTEHPFPAHKIAINEFFRTKNCQ